MEPLLPLIDGCVRRDRYSQHRLYQLLANKMLGVCLRYAHSREEAEEILQEGFLKVFEKIDQYQQKGAFEGWVRKIMVNTALQRFRQEASKPAAPLSLEAIQHDPEAHEAASAQLDAKALLTLIQLLPPAYKMVFNLYVFEGMKHKEIAALLGISEGTSKSNLSDARTLLQKAIRQTENISVTKQLAHE